MQEDGIPNSIAKYARYQVGRSSADGIDESRNFFVYDLSDITGTIVSASFRIWQRQKQGDDTFTLSTSRRRWISVERHRRQQRIRRPRVGQDLRIAGVPIQSEGTMFALNAEAIADIQSTLGTLFALGGALTTLDGPDDQYLFRDATSGNDTMLILEIASEPTAAPEPATLTLLGAGLVTLATRARRRRGERS